MALQRHRPHVRGDGLANALWEGPQRLWVGRTSRTRVAVSRAVCSTRRTTASTPAAVKAEERRAETFADLAREYVERHAKHKRSGHEDVRLLSQSFWSGHSDAAATLGVGLGCNVDIPAPASHHLIPDIA
jgi:hypothetical protein